MAVELEKPVDIRGIKVSVEVDDNGSFHAKFLERHFLEDSLEKLRDRMLEASRKQAVKISIEVEREMHVFGTDPGATRRATITGIHQGTGNLLVRWRTGDGRIGASSQESSSGWMRRLTNEECAELRAIRVAGRALEERERKFMEKVTVDAKRLAREAIEHALRKEGE